MKKATVPKGGKCLGSNPVRDERGICQCRSCAGHRRAIARLKQRDRLELRDAYLARRMGKPQCDMTLNDWLIAWTIRMKILLERQITKTRQYDQNH